jgi:proteic killer suppression protein
MEIAFEDNDLDKLETDAKFDAGHSPAIVKAFRKRMQFIRDSVDERDFGLMRSLNFERLKGERSHQYSMRLNDQWRLIVELHGEAPNKTVVVVSIEDYH